LSKIVLTILLLGETGHGKTTLINAIANYLLFDSFEDAMKAELFLPIKVKITLTDSVYFTDTVKEVGGCPVTHRDLTDVNTGDSDTENPSISRFQWRNITLNVIDTPGLNATPDKKQSDDECIANILTYISELELNAIALVFNNQQCKNTENFQRCVVKILQNMHESAKDNLVFCVTNSGLETVEFSRGIKLIKQLLVNQKLGNIAQERERYFMFENSGITHLTQQYFDPRMVEKSKCEASVGDVV
jgi:GTPase SAR1 family protein